MKKLVGIVLPDANIHAFLNAAELLQFAEEHTINIAFLDIQMRGITGTEVAHKLQAMQPRINVIFCTAYDDYKGHAMDLHASGYLMKPVTVEDIRRELSMLRFPLEADDPGTAAPEQLKVTCFGLHLPRLQVQR